MEVRQWTAMKVHYKIPAVYITQVCTLLTTAQVISRTLYEKF
jgi:hypothetical protein